MGYSFQRTDKRGRVRWTACYQDVHGRVRSAGTFSTEKLADRAWQRAEAKVAEGRLGDPARGRMTVRRYVEEVWLPHHRVELTTRGNYTYSLYRHILPEFGDMKMVSVFPEQVRQWVTALQETGLSPATIKTQKDILSAIFTTALHDQIVSIHPCRGVKTPPIPPSQITVVTPEQFDVIYKALPDADAQLLVETDIESGLRWGELTELRVKDLNFGTRIVTVSRAVVEVAAAVRVDGQRFAVKEYPKDRKHRRFKLSAQIVQKLRAHCEAEGLGREDLLFSIRGEDFVEAPRLRVIPNPEELGLTPPNEKGRQYRHGTATAYGDGKCRCEHCKAAVAMYRASRRAQGKDRPPKGERRRLGTDGHIPNNWFRNHVWNQAVATADIGIRVRPHDLRHAHASWLLAGGADLQVVKERLGHASISTTERYLHTLPDADDTALTALESIRRRTR